MNFRLPRGSAPFLLAAAALVPAALTALPGRNELAEARRAAVSDGAADPGCEHGFAHDHEHAPDDHVAGCAHEAARRMLHGAPGTDAPGDRALYLMELAAKAGAKFQGAAPDPKAERKAGGYLFHIAILEAEGSFASLHALLKLVETGERIAVVESAQLRRKKSDAPAVRLKARLRFVERVSTSATDSLRKLAHDDAEHPADHESETAPRGSGR